MSTTEKRANIAFKKILGVSETLDPNGNSLAPEAEAFLGRNFVLPSQIWSQTLPARIPADLLSVTTDRNGFRLQNSSAGVNSTASPWIRRYFRVKMQQLRTSGPVGTNQGFRCWGCNLYATDPMNGISHTHPEFTSGNPSFPRGRAFRFDRNDTDTYNILVGAIPTNVITGADYNIVVEYKDANGNYVELARGSAAAGSWYVDTDTGILTFFDYQNVSSIIHANSTPYISFYRYVGTRGFSSGTSTSNTATTSTGTTDPSTSTTTGSNIGSADVIIDNRDMSVTPESHALRFGGDYDGSWKIYVKGGQGVHTSLVISYRKGGQWNSINLLGPFVNPNVPVTE